MNNQPPSPCVERLTNITYDYFYELLLTILIVTDTFRVSNIGRLLGKDIKPLNVYRRAQFEEPTIFPDDAPTSEAFNYPKDYVDKIYESVGNRGMKPASFTSMFKDNTSKKTVNILNCGEITGITLDYN
ncbi:hypothetical protein Tco_0866038 [Tanacetum coccineum]